MGWVERAADLLYDGESIEREVRVGEGGVVVTSHRVLAFTPDREGANFQQVDRPNVDGVDVETDGQVLFLMQAVKAIVVGLVLLAAGLTISLDSMVSGISLDIGGGAAAGAMGLGRMMGLLQGLLTLLAQLDDIMRIFGVLALAFGLVVLGVYVWSREQLLVVSVAGGDDIKLTAPDEEGIVERVRAAVRPGGGPGAGASGGQPPANGSGTSGR